MNKPCKTPARFPATAVFAAACTGALILLAGYRAKADVYTLLPDADPAQRGVAEILQTKPVLSEPVSVNGAAGTLTVGSTPLSPADAAQFLKPKPGLTFLATGNSSLIADEKASATELRRHFIVSSDPKCKTVVFSLRLPTAAAKTEAASAAWPSELPEAPGTPVLAMSLSRTESSISTYNSPRNPTTAAAEYAELLRQAGWKPLSSTPGAAEFLNPKTNRLALLRASPSPAGSLVAIFCSRTIKDAGA